MSEAEDIEGDLARLRRRIDKLTTENIELRKLLKLIDGTFLADMLASKADFDRDYARVLRGKIAALLKV